MPLSGKIIGFFDHQYLWKETTNVLDFLHGDVNQRRAACKTTTADWGGGGSWMPSHAQTCLYLPMVNLVGLWVVVLH